MARKDVPTHLVLRAHLIYRDRNKWPYELLSEWTGQPEKVCYRAMERDYDKGYLIYGVSLRTAWLTEKGKRYLSE